MALCAAMGVRRRADLCRVACMAAGAVLPESQIDTIQSLFKVHSMGGSMLSKRQINVDSAFCLMMKRHWVCQNGGPIYLWADSSPQAGVDWLLSTSLFIDGSNLAGCVESANFLYSSVSAFQEAHAAGDVQVMEHIALERHRHGIRLKEQMIRHRNLPMGLGSGSTSAEHKCKAICRAILTETQTVAAALLAMRRVKGICTDMGTELALSDLAGFTPREMLPDWIQDPPGLEPDIGIGDGAEEAVPAGMEMHVFPHALASAGVVHITNNIEWGVENVLSFWPTCLPGFKALAHLLHHDHLRKRYVDKCIRGSRFAHRASTFANAVPNPAKWRWGIVVNTLRKMLPMRLVLQATWRPDAFSGDARAGNEHDGPGDKLDVKLLTKTIRSAQWWAYANMIRLLNGFADEFREWAESCPCHGWLHRQDPDSGDRHTGVCLQLEAIRASLSLAPGVGDGIAFSPCPLAGFRAWELADGALEKHMESLSETYLAEIMEMTEQVTETELQIILHDFSTGKAHVHMALHEKLKFWRVMPWSMAALGSPDTAAARRAAAQMVKEFDAAPRNPALHHRVTWEHMQEDSAVRLEMERFIAGDDMTDLPALSKFVAELRFIPCSERMQEGDHSLLHRTVGYRTVQGPYCSTLLRKHEYESLLADEAQRPQLVANLEAVYKINDVVPMLGLQDHPLWQDMLRTKASSADRLSAAQAIMYSLDAHTQFANVKALSTKRKHGFARKEKRCNGSVA